MGLSISLAEAIVLAAVIFAVAAVIVAWILASNRQNTSGAQGTNQPWNPLGLLSPTVEFPQSKAGHPVEPTDIPVSSDTPLRIGSTVLSYSQGRWWRAEVLRLGPGDLVQIHFPGWDAKWDTTIPRDELQVDLYGPDR